MPDPDETRQGKSGSLHAHIYLSFSIKNHQLRKHHDHPTRHEPPGNLSDLTGDSKDKWSKGYICHWMQGEIKADPRVVGAGRTPLTQFFDGTVTPFNQQDKPLPDSSRVVQDEYLEWSVSRGPRKYTGDIYSVTFSAEGPEYWQLLASFQKGDFLKLTRDFNSGFTSQMSDSDFFLTDPMTKNEVYNPGNQWNLLSITGTIAHLIQAKNTLSAGIDIGVQARVIRKDDQGNVIEDKDDLINCSKYGNPGRNSDPTIGKAINDLACKGASLTVAEPAALYIRNFDTRNFQFHVFQWQRGDISTKHGLRIKFEVPKDRLDKHGKPLLVSNIYDTRTKWHIKYGAQFADYFTMGISAMGVKGKAANPEKCYQPSTKAAASVKPSCAEFDGFAHPGFAGAPGPSRA
ncbi:hypothetical protein ANOM_004148 [Aspergillus nomiae NRRL 13137]|uniref:Uncharacterized protein n=1 Tax=Aspergillus nomiae NRRL (strain ATCC 15546 / NRRL 13137 / CBS 260.88 / M93) TaxID=1509407 RepID=A0A0L1J7C7_ASPN3|nr:uncharacterized protein ANOM_004148 [Aspergillus nomiae NRRL 13137]KNG87654.1 hypothetical protein ANOM_004148 [Aspergillus nomiae NRRL 13137]